MIEVRTMHADGSRSSVIVGLDAAGDVYRAALAKAWASRRGDYVLLLPA